MSITEALWHNLEADVRVHLSSFFHFWLLLK